VVVTAGIHWDGIAPGGVEIVRSLCDEISKSLIERVSERKRLNGLSWVSQALQEQFTGFE
jgi:hypothetical protein